MPPAINSFLRASQCSSGTGKFPYVCCNPYDTYRPTEATTELATESIQTSNSVNGKNLPEPGECGPVSTGNKIYNGNNTDIDEFPWMVLLEYQNGKGVRQFSCGGVLINQRYVLSVAHCLKGSIEVKIGKL